MMFSSKWLEDRNNDPQPYAHEAYGDRCEVKLSSYIWAPRPEFQYGKLAANYVLVGFRVLIHEHRRTYAAELDQLVIELMAGTLPEHFTIEVSLAEIFHAHRVITLWRGLA